MADGEKTAEQKADSGGGSRRAESGKYTREQLVAGSQLRLGTSPYVVEAALSETEAEHLTVAQAQKLVDSFLNREVQ